MENLEVDSELTRAKNLNLRVRAESILRALDEHLRVLDQIGPCWGRSDEVARSFEKVYVPTVRDFVEACRNLAGSIESTANSVDEAMKGFEHVEQGNTHLARRSPQPPAGSPAPPPAA